MLMNSFGITDKGIVRRENQDSYIVEKCDRQKASVVVICDGMGGAKAGDLASQLSSKAFVSRIYETVSSRRRYKGSFERLLKKSCDEANGVVYEYSGFDSEYTGMGTTLVGGVITRKRAYLVNVGDSRAYHISHKGISQITKDHSYVQELVDSGAISVSEARYHPKKNIITRALGVDSSVESDYFELPLSRGDAVLLCSDGLSNMLSDDEIYSTFVESGSSAELCCNNLMKTALDRGARDNVSIVLVTV